MADPVFGFDEIDPHSKEGGGKPVTLSTVDNYWSDWFKNNATNAGVRANPYQTANQDQARLQQQQSKRKR